LSAVLHLSIAVLGKAVKAMPLQNVPDHDLGYAYVVVALQVPGDSLLLEMIISS